MSWLFWRRKKLSVLEIRTGSAGFVCLYLDGKRWMPKNFNMFTEIPRETPTPTNPLGNK